MIEAHQLTRTFTGRGHTVEAVKGIDLTIGQGELVALLGPNGAGKSTTLRMLTTLLSPTSGTATVAGRDIATDPQGVRARIGYVGQKSGAGHSFRVGDELRMQGLFYGLDPATTRRRSDELLATLDLEGMAKRQASTLSGGQKRRLDIAMGLIHQPGLLFLDEPTTGMDPQARANLWEHIERLRRETGMTIVLTTHYLDEADAMAKRVVIIDSGRIIADDSPQGLKAHLAGDRLTLTVSTADVEPAIAVLRSRGIGPDEPEQKHTDSQHTTVSVRVPSAARALPLAIHELQSAGVPVAAATGHEPTLDDVFLTLTGRSLREGADA